MWTCRSEFVCHRLQGAERIAQRLSAAVSGQQRRHASSVVVVATDDDFPWPAVVEPQERGTSSVPKIPTHVYSSLSSSNGECLDYVRGWAWQQLLLNRRLALRRRRLDEEHQGRDGPQSTASVQESDPPCAANDPDIVMLLEHRHVYTLGRGADERHLTFLGDPLCGASPQVLDHDRHIDACRARLARTARGPGSARLSLDRRHSLLGAKDLADAEMQEAVERLCRGATSVVAPNGVPIYRVERGGECTYHGPGQLVVYPMLDLNRQPKADLHEYLRRLEEVVMRTLSVYGIDGVRDHINTGVWVNHRKVAAVGVSASKWITTHGFAINVGPDLDYFDTSVILPCGIEGRGVTSLRDILAERGAHAPTVRTVSRVVLEQLTRVFNLDVEARHNICPSDP